MNKIIKTQIIVLIFQVLLYFGCEYFQSEPKDVEREFDKKIPVKPLFTLIYILWFPLIALFPISLHRLNPSLYSVYMKAWIADIIISVIIYMVYPTTFERPKNLDEIKYGWMLKYIYKASYKGVNCMPSMHCSISTLSLIGSLLSLSLSPLLMTIYALVSLGIIISTLYTKQHVIIDLITGVSLGAILFVIFYLSKN